MSLHVLIFLEIVVQLEPKKTKTETEPKPKPRIEQNTLRTPKQTHRLSSSISFFLLCLSYLLVYFLFLSEMLNLLTAVVFLFNLFYLRYLLSSCLVSVSVSVAVSVPAAVSPSSSLVEFNFGFLFRALSLPAHFNVKQLTWLGLKFSLRACLSTVSVLVFVANN